LITKRAGLDTFLDKLSSVSKSPFYSLAAQRPQLKFRKPDDLIYDYEFCNLVKVLEHIIVNAVKPEKDVTEAVMNTEQSRLLEQYKEVIRQQDQELQILRKQTSDMTLEIAHLKSENEHLSASVQQLSDQNALLKAQQSVVAGSNYPPNNMAIAEEGLSSQWFHDLQKTNDQLNHQIYDLTAEINRLKLSPPESFVGQGYPNHQQEQELLNIRSENDFLRQEVSRLTSLLQHNQQLFYPDNTYTSNVNPTCIPSPSASLLASNHSNSEVDSLKKEQEDLLLLLTDQDTKIREYKERLRQLGQSVEDDELVLTDSYNVNGV
jgi:hypothetical protein